MDLEINCCLFGIYCKNAINSEYFMIVCRFTCRVQPPRMSPDEAGYCSSHFQAGITRMVLPVSFIVTSSSIVMMVSLSHPFTFDASMRPATSRCLVS